MEKAAPKLIVIGGSWGGIKASLAILEKLPPTFGIPIVLVLHRLRNFEGNLQELFRRKIKLKAVEIEEKESMEAGYVYIAPANYHVLIENDQTFSLDDSELENYSRPSIDVTFSSAAYVFGEQVTGILLSGASKDGSTGLKYLAERGGTAIVQDPQEAEVGIMPLAAIDIIPGCSIMNTDSIQKFLVSLHDDR